MENSAHYAFCGFQPNKNLTFIDPDYIINKGQGHKILYQEICCINVHPPTKYHFIWKKNYDSMAILFTPPPKSKLMINFNIAIFEVKLLKIAQEGKWQTSWF